MPANTTTPPFVPTRSQVRVQTIISISLLLVGLLLIYLGVLTIGQANESRSWPTVTGRITDIRTVSDLSVAGEMPDTEYHYAVTYTYEVDGQAYRNDRYSLGEGDNAGGRTYDTEAEAREAGFAAYTPDDDITVYYDPTDPSSAVLDPGQGLGTLAPILLGLPSLLGGVWLFRRARSWPEVKADSV